MGALLRCVSAATFSPRQSSRPYCCTCSRQQHYDELVVPWTAVQTRSHNEEAQSATI